MTDQLTPHNIFCWAFKFLLKEKNPICVYCFVVVCSAASFTELDRNYLTPFFTSNNGDYDDEGNIEQHHGNNIIYSDIMFHYYICFICYFSHAKTMKFTIGFCRRANTIY